MLPTRFHVWIGPITFATLIGLAVMWSVLRSPHSDTSVPSCFDQVAKAAAKPGDRCNVVH